MSQIAGHDDDLTLGRKLIDLNWGLVLLLTMMAAVGILMLYSVADGNLEPWAWRHAVRFGAGAAIMITVALVNIRFWYHLAYPVYLVGIGMLLAVEFFGASGGGAERWLRVGPVQMQPSEFMKIAVVLALARYFHIVPYDRISSPRYLIIPTGLVAIPVLLVLRQPDLGTALLICFAAVGMLFAAGVRIWYFVAVGVAGLAAIPAGWYTLKDYQRARIMTFLDPESDPMGAGYHIMQSKIAFGSGGISGRGFLKGTQAHLDFLPEKHTDFIFTTLAEEFGMTGGMFFLTLCFAVLAYSIMVSVRIGHSFGRLLAMGIAITFFLYISINVAMAMGLIPVVGVPLPLVSYGGTSMLAVMGGFGLLMSAYIHRDVELPRYGKFA